MDKLKSIQIKDKKTIITLAVFAVLFIAAILVGGLALHQNFAIVVVIMLLEVFIAACLHHVELWIHGVVILVQVVVGALPIVNIWIVIIAVLIYVATIAALKVLDGKKN